MTSTQVRSLDSRPDTHSRDLDRLPTPYLQLDIDQAVGRFVAIAAAFGPRSVHYAVKANPHPALVGALARAGCRFDVASPAEVEVCLGAGADPGHLIYSNPMKRRIDIASARDRGVGLFVADSAAEIDKIAAEARGASVLVRLATSGAGSDWPLSGKFGCAAEEVVPLLLRAADRGLQAAGISFHVGSQQRDPARWEPPIAAAAAAWTELRRHGLTPSLLDIGGGLPAAHLGDHPGLYAYRDRIEVALTRGFGEYRPELIIEPGRGIVGDAGSVVAEVLGVTWRGGRRWVYLDVGIYTGLVETLGEAIRYRLRTDRDTEPSGPVVLAGPTCDSVDVLYERTPVQLPLSLREGDCVTFCSAGAYTTSYSTVGFNGFAPLPTVLAGSGLCRSNEGGHPGASWTSQA
jgi:ornithine decarboxylase